MNHLKKTVLLGFLLLFILTGCSRLTSLKQSIFSKKESVAPITTETKVKSSQADTQKLTKEDKEEGSKPKVKEPTAKNANNDEQKSTTDSISQPINDQEAFRSAQKAKDSSQCQTIVKIELKNFCLEQVLLNQAISSKDTKYCEELAQDEDKAECYKLVEK